MRAVILAGGQGTRLRPYTTVLPKPLLPLGDRPVLELIVRRLVASGFDQLDLCVGHLGHLIKAYFNEAVTLPADVQIRYWWEDEPLGTAGALHGVERPEETFLVMNGDVVTTLDFREFMWFHRESGAPLTIAACRKDVRIDLGVIDNDGSVVTNYREKPILGFRVSMGIYAYEPVVLDHIPREHFDFPDVVRALIDARERVAIYPFDGKWFDIGTLAEYERAAQELEAAPELFRDA